MNSLDPRVNRIQTLDKIDPIKAKEHWPTWEVFHQKKRGGQAQHVGIVHAADPELALVFAKEQFSRRFKCVNLWVVKSAEVYTFRYEDEDMFETTVEKKYRDGNYYKVRDKIEKYQKENKIDEQDNSKTYFGVKYDG